MDWYFSLYSKFLSLDRDLVPFGIDRGNPLGKPELCFRAVPVPFIFKRTCRIAAVGRKPFDYHRIILDFKKLKALEGADPMINILILVFLAEIFDTTGQIFYKRGADRVRLPDYQRKSWLVWIKNIFAAPQIGSGIIFVGIGLIIWLMALSQRDLSFVFPLRSIQYVLVLVGGSLFLGEKIDKFKLAGTFFILFGILLVVGS